MLEAVAKTIDHDGLIYDEERPERPWNSGIGCGKGSWREDYSTWPAMGDLSSGFALLPAGRRRVDGLSGLAGPRVGRWTWR